MRPSYVNVLGDDLTIGHLLYADDVLRTVPRESKSSPPPGGSLAASAKGSNLAKSQHPLVGDTYHLAQLQTNL